MPPPPRASAAVAAEYIVPSNEGPETTTHALQSPIF